MHSAEVASEYHGGKAVRAAMCASEASPRGPDPIGQGGPAPNLGPTRVSPPSDRDRTRVAALDVVLEDRDEFGDEALTAQRAIEAAVDEDRRDRLLERPGQRDADV